MAGLDPIDKWRAGWRGCSGGCRLPRDLGEPEGPELAHREDIAEGCTLCRGTAHGDPLRLRTGWRVTAIRDAQAC